jgi:hypothetical protein
LPGLVPLPPNEVDALKGIASLLLRPSLSHSHLHYCTLHLSQRQYCLDIPECFGFANASPVSTPLDPGVHLDASISPSTPEQVEYMKTVPYINAVGALMYLAIVTRGDIAYTMGVLCRFMANPGVNHWKAVKHLFCYLAGTTDD